ncbi:Hypothetical predicted protein, partial [Marmota monax]
PSQLEGGAGPLPLGPGGHARLGPGSSDSAELPGLWQQLQRALHPGARASSPTVTLGGGSPLWHWSVL